MLKDKAVLMRFSAGLPGQHRKDKKLSSEVTHEKNLGSNAGKWITNLYPEGALDEIKSKQTEARAYHDKVTFPFGSRSDNDDGSTPAIAGIGILPAALIAEYGAKMRQFKGEMDLLTSVFLDQGQRWVDWAKAEHNGTFNPKNYPGCDDSGGFNLEEFKAAMIKRFYLRTEPLPVPDAEQFSVNVTALLGVDAESVNLRVRDAGLEAQRELMRRLIEPVKAMVDKLSEGPKLKDGKEKDIVFRDSLVGNIREIAELAPKMNLSGDAAIDEFIGQVEALGAVHPEDLRKDKKLRQSSMEQALATLKRLESYKF